VPRDWARILVLASQPRQGKHADPWDRHEAMDPDFRRHVAQVLASQYVYITANVGAAGRLAVESWSIEPRVFDLSHPERIAMPTEPVVI
jgi:hypothetical protein